MKKLIIAIWVVLSVLWVWSAYYAGQSLDRIGQEMQSLRMERYVSDDVAQNN